MAITLNGTTGIVSPKVNTLDLELDSKNVVERGSNANGEYVRFADGTQICRGLHTDAPGADRPVTFPASFVATPACVGNVFITNGASTLSCVTVRTITATTAVICPRYENAGGTISIPPEGGDYVAIGRRY